MAKKALDRIQRLRKRFPNMSEEKARLLLVSCAMGMPTSYISSDPRFERWMVAGMKEYLKQDQHDILDHVAFIEEFSAEPVNEDSILYTDFYLEDDDRFDDYYEL